MHVDADPRPPKPPMTWTHLCSFSNNYESMPVTKKCHACGSEALGPTAVAERDRIRNSLVVLKEQASNMSEALLKLTQDTVAMTRTLESFIEAIQEDDGS